MTELNTELILLQRELRLLFKIPHFDINRIKQEYNELAYKAKREPFLEQLTVPNLLAHQFPTHNWQRHCVDGVWGEIHYDTHVSYSMGDTRDPLAIAEVYTADHNEAINWVKTVGYNGGEPYEKWHLTWLRIKWLPLELEYNETEVFNSVPRITLYGDKLWYDVMMEW